VRRNGDGSNGLRIEIKTAVEARKAWKAGRDIQAELWAASGSPRPVEACELPINTPLPEVRIGGRETELIQCLPPTLFPIDEYIRRLFISGELKASGTRQNDPESRPISRENWGCLAIGESEDSSRRGVWRDNSTRYGGDGDFENVRVARDGVLRVFPAEPPTAAEPPAAEASQEAQPDSAQSSTPPIVHARRPRGPKADKGKMVLEAMRRDIEAGVDLENMLEKKMVEKYSAARDTCRKYRDIALAQTSTNSDNYSANDK
jgi:hypothetical protein